MDLDSEQQLLERYRLRLRELINEWSRDRAGFSRNLVEPLVVSRAEQEGLLLILFEYAHEAARSWFESSARYYKRADFALMMFVHDVQTLWMETSNVRFENTGALPFHWEVFRPALQMHEDDNGKSYRDALNKAIERQIEVRFATVAEEFAEEDKVDAADAPERSDVLSDALADQPQETREDPPAAEHLGEEPQSSTDQLALKIAGFLSGDPEEVARAARDLARDLEELRPTARAATQTPAHQTAALHGETFGQYLSREMRRLGLTDAKVAERSGKTITRQHVARLRKANHFKRGPGVDTLKALANATGIDLAELTRLAGPNAQ